MFQRELLAWFDAHARDLPWRRSSDPYRIWVSEIMLQQTRVTAVLDYYARFLAMFPTVAALAAAEEADVLAAWSGLGYYRRAKQMRQAAQVVVREHQGILPRTAEQLRRLPGIGQYTSSAIASIAYGEPAAVVDGNVERVLLRLFPGDGEPGQVNQAKRLRERAASLLDTARPGDFNQSMMELGAMVVPAPAPFVPPLPGATLLRHPRGAPVAPAEEDAQPADRLRAVVPQSSGRNPGSAAAASHVCVADAGHVGTAGGGDGAGR